MNGKKEVKERIYTKIKGYTIKQREKRAKTRDPRSDLQLNLSKT